MLQSKTPKHDSSVALTTPVSSENTNTDKSNVTSRKMRKQNSQLDKSDDESPITSPGPSSAKSSSFSVSEEQLRNIVNDELRKTIKQHVTAELKNITEQFSGLKMSMDFFNTQFEDMKTKLDEKNAVICELQADNEKLKCTVKDLGYRLNLVEQNMRETNIELNGITEHKEENMINTIAQMVKIIGNPIAPEDILHATRVAKLVKDNNRPRTVVAKLRTPRHRDAVLAAVVKFNRSNQQDKLSTKHLGLSGPRNPVFVAEHLSPQNKALHAATRIRVRELKYKFTWIRNGRIFVRKDEFSESILIRHMDSLNLLK